MTTLQWPLLNSSSFEALVQTLIFYKDSKASLFNRPGPDCAQDAKSGDGKTVYQAKFHPTNTQSSSHAFSDAKNECEKIKQYKSENDARWNNVKAWILVSPVTFGSQDYERWNEEILPLFKEIGLQADIWPSSVLEAEIAQRPELKEVFFEGANRCFLSLPEFRDYLLNDRLGEPGLRINCIGRDREINAVKTFLTDPEKKLLPIVGESGIGKTRLLYESGRQSLDGQSNRQTFWAQVSTMGSSEHWFKAIPFHVPTLVLIDGLDALEYEYAHKILQTLREQILTPQSQWKAIISVPSLEWLDGITNHSRYKSDAEPIELVRLSKDDAKKMVQELLLVRRPDIKGPIQEKIGEEIASHSNTIPLWIVAGTCILSEEGSLLKTIEDPYGIAKTYLKSSLKNFKESEIEYVLFWVAVYQPIQKTDKNFISFISRIAGISVSKTETLLMKAEDQKIVYSYGISKRFIKIVPQGLADNIIYQKLLNRSGKPSPTALAIFDELLNKTDKVYEPQKILHAFGKVGFHSDAFKNILRQFSDRIILYIQKSNDVAALRKYFELSKPLAIYEPERYLAVIREFRIKDNVPNKTVRVKYLPPHTITYKKEVQFHLARTVYDSSSFVHDDSGKKLLLDEMIELCNREFDWFTEQERERRNNEDKGGLRKLSDILFMGSPYLHGYHEVARELARKYLGRLKQDISETRDIKIIEAVIKPQLKVERRTTYWLDDKIVWETRPVYGYPAETRKLIVDELHNIFKSKAGSSSVMLCLSLLSEAHHEANGASLGRWLNPPSDQVKNEYFDECQENLNLIYDKLPVLSLEERELAHKIWDWHLRFDKREALQDLASKCEELRQNSLDKLDLSIFSYNRWDEDAPKDIDKRIARLATSIAKESDKKIHSYLNEALILQESNHTGQHITELAQQIGQKYFKNTSVQKYASKSLSVKKLVGNKYGHFQIAIVMIASRCALIRKNADGQSRELSNLVESHVDAIPSADNKIKFLYGLYADRYGSPFSNQDLKLILKYRPLFTKRNEYPRYFNLLGCVFLLDPKPISKMIEKLWISVPRDKRSNTYEGFLNGLGLARTPELLAPYRKWLFEQTIWIHDPDRLEHTFRFIDIFRDWKCSLQDFYQITLRRFKQSGSEKKSSEYKILPDDEFLKWVEKIDNKSPVSKTINILAKYLTLDTKKNWQISHYLPEVLSTFDPQGVFLPDLIAKKIKSLKSMEAKRYWLRYAGHYPERSKQWSTIVMPILKSIQGMSKEIKNPIYSLICRDFSRPSSWCGSASDHWQARVTQVEKELQEEQDPYARDYLEWKIECIRGQRDHFVEWEEED